MGTLILPDIHHRYGVAEAVIALERPDTTVFLGDYFDSHGDSAGDAARTAAWLAGSLEKKGRVHLIGNHDLSYMTRNPAHHCSGFTEAKYYEIARHAIPWNMLRPYYWVGGEWLCTHAGVSRTYLDARGWDSVQDALDGAESDLGRLDGLDYGDPSFFQVGESRGGEHGAGGPVWCDYGEFEPVPGVYQVFGHTRDNEVRRTECGGAINYCLDTVLSHYAVYGGGELEVREVPESCREG